MTDAIDEGRALALLHNGPSGAGFQNNGKLNAYQCERCHFYIVTIDREPGVTPFLVRCRNCGGTAQSAMYRVAGKTPTWEWVRPANLDGLSRESVEHIRKGGLILQPIDPAKPEWTAPPTRFA